MTTATAKATPDSIVTMVPDSPTLTIEREFDAPIERVFLAWTTSEGLRAWMGPEGCTAPDATCDAREGGQYCVPILGSDGSINTVRGTYHTVDAPNLLVFTWQWDQSDGSEGREMLVTVKFEAVNGGTRMHFHQVNFIDDEARDKHNFGWSSSFDCLDKHLAA